MGSSNSNTAAKKVNTTTETIMGSAAVKFDAAASNLRTNLQAGLDLLNGMEARGSELALAVVNRQGELAELDVKFGETKRQKEVELRLAVQADEAGFATSWAEKNGKTLIDNDVLNREREASAELNAEFSKKVAAEVAAATSNMKKAHESELQLQSANFRAEQATTNAQLASLTQQLADARAEAARWEAAAAAERNAGIERAKAQGSATINVGNDTTRR